MLASTAFPPQPSGMPMQARGVGASSAYGQNGSGHDNDVIAIEMPPAQSRRRGGAEWDTEDSEVFDREYEVRGKRVRLMPVQNEGPCGTFAGIQTVMMATLAVTITTLLVILTLSCVGYFYVYPNLVNLMDDKIKNFGELAINLAVENSEPVLEMVECIITHYGDSVNAALGPLLGTEINFGGTGNNSLAAMCPLSFAGINHTVSTATMDEVLGSSFETSAPSFHSQLHDLKYGATHGSSSGGEYAPVEYLSSDSSDDASTVVTDDSNEYTYYT